MGIEFEMKYAATPESQAAIRAFLGGCFHTYAMQTTYYDTPAKELSAQRWTLRRRLENETSICTLKTPGTGLGRGEGDCEKNTIEEAIPELCKLSGRQELSSLAGKLVPICGARFTRQAFPIDSNGTTLEVALDRGVLLGGGKEAPLCEVEVELKSGEEQEVLLFARVLEHKFGLTPEPRSKFRRALDLAKGE